MLRPTSSVLAPLVKLTIGQLSPDSSRILREESGLPEGIADCQGRKAGEIPVAGDELADSVLEAERCNVSVVDQVPRNTGFLNDRHHDFGVVRRLLKKDKSWRSKKSAQITQGHPNWDGRVIDSWMSHHAEKLVDAWPRNGPWE